ncbi:unnamed protein product [Penicillium egyptiacum]|uniref:Uncharacterized protein n=1 Tax=Penicillium egyptiacum TaxID=1303716 RepID=A0A9W4P4S6_9EURO|nr:unnamed protein product [Penicillium egyptiacum]
MMMPPGTSLLGGDDILEGLPPSTHRYQYECEQQFLDVMFREHDLWSRGETNEFVVFINLDERTFHRGFLESSEKLINNSWQSYSSLSQCLHARMKTGTHEELHFAFYDLLREKLVPMGLGHSLHRQGGRTTSGGPKGKQADNGLYPRRLPPGRTDKWPSVVIEVAFSESKTKLRCDLDWWLSQSNGDVKTAISLSTNKSKREIIIEAREMVEGSKGRAPALQQQVVIRKQTADSITSVTNAPFTIAFESLLLRPTTQPAEGDLELTEDDLQKLAEEVWETQSFRDRTMEMGDHLSEDGM